MQSQLGVVLAFIAFLPLIIFILTNKKIDGKSKAILGSIAGVALVIAGIGGAEFNPASVEKYTEETNMVEALTGTNNVYWTKSGGRYHLYEDCGYIKNSTSIMNGTVAESYETKGIDQLCQRCKGQKMKEDGLSEETLNQKLEKVKEGLHEETSDETETSEEVKDAA